MHDLEIWNHFIEEDVLPQRNEQIKSLHTYYVQHKKQIIAQLVPLFDQFCEKVRLQQQEGQLMKCAYLHLSLLRTSLNEGKPVYMLEASDRDTQSKVQLTPFHYDAGWIYRFADAWDQACEEKRRRYINRIHRHSFEVWKARQLYPFHIYMVHAVRYAMDTIRQLVSFQSLEKDSTFEVRVVNFGILRSVNLCIASMKGNVPPLLAKGGWKISRIRNTSMNILPRSTCPAAISKVLI
ncbi:hypothetical protein NSS79_17985 [Paenibacillus sp. FSL L8-0436]|uniref:hypothetical protein n=1 Tax=Paenibacillus sp. FSL L8-0436 TaxID=2954686 RepID=UPI0031585A6A